MCSDRYEGTARFNSAGFCRPCHHADIDDRNSPRADTRPRGNPDCCPALTDADCGCGRSLSDTYANPDGSRAHGRSDTNRNCSSAHTHPGGNPYCRPAHTDADQSSARALSDTYANPDGSRAHGHSNGSRNSPRAHPDSDADTNSRGCFSFGAVARPYGETRGSLFALRR